MRKFVVIGLLALLGVAVPWQLGAEIATEAATRQSYQLGLSVSPSPVVVGQTATITAQVKPARRTTVTVETRVLNGQGGVVWSNRWGQQAFNGGQQRSFAANWAVPAGQPAGGYRAEVRLVNSVGGTVASRVLAITVGGGAPPPPAGDAVDLDAEEAAFLNLINQYRQQHGLVPLAVNRALSAAAVWQSNDMAVKRYFSHTDSLGRDPFQRMAAFGYTANTWKGENIAAGYTTASAVFNGWKASAGHNANMLNGNYRVIGIGRVAVAGSPYGVYWTTDFGGA